MSSPELKPFVASSFSGIVEYCHTYYAEDLEHAKQIAERNGWTLNGPVESLIEFYGMVDAPLH